MEKKNQTVTLKKGPFHGCKVTFDLGDEVGVVPCDTAGSEDQIYAKYNLLDGTFLGKYRLLRLHGGPFDGHETYVSEDACDRLVAGVECVGGVTTAKDCALMEEGESVAVYSSKTGEYMHTAELVCDTN